MIPFSSREARAQEGGVDEQSPKGKRLDCPPPKPLHASQAVGSTDLPGCLGSEEVNIDLGL